MLLNFIPLLPIIIVLCFAAIRFWGFAIVGVLVWAMFEGAVRKWVLPGFQSQLLLVKDFVLLFAYLGYFISARSSEDLGPKSGTLLFLLLLEAVYCAIQLVNPNSPSSLLSLFGLKNYLIYLPLAFIIPDIIKDRLQLRKIMISTCYLAVPIALLGLYQFSQPPTSWVNQYVSHEEGVEAVVSLFGEQGEGDFKLGRARTSSTFSYIGGFMTFLLLAVPLATSLLLASIPKRRTLLIVTAALALSIGGAATTGARTPMVVFAFAGPLLLLIGGWKGLLPFQTALRFAVGLAIVGVATVTIFGTAFSALEYRANNSDSAINRLATPITEAADAFETSPLIGTGIGSNSNAAMSLIGGDYLWWLNGNAYELETARVMQEMGFVGFTLVFLPKAFVIVLVLGHLRKSKSPLMIAAHMASLIFVIVHLVLFTVNNPTGGLIYWTIVGVSIAAFRVEMAERRNRSQQDFYLERGYPLGDVALA
ncbi:O-antigen ligase [Sphingomonas sp. UYAg733]